MTALVLSAGGMFGAYQAGVWQVIAGRIPIDMVVGASVGALNGYAIASGCTPERLIEAWRDPSAGDTLRRYPGSFRFDPAGLREQAERLMAEFTPRIPLALTTVEFPSFKTRVFRAPAITPAHLAATCSIPVFLPMVRIDGKRQMDGGILDRMPLWIAAEAGATRIIVVDVLSRIQPWWVNAGIAAIRLLANPQRTFQGIDITVITPSQPLGHITAASRWNRADVDRWIDLGTRHAQRTLIM